ncbi:MAG: DUF6036 family nucleotidyltransferase [Nanobdellota archaeon]
MVTKNDLLRWLESIDRGLEKEITLIAVGGTALTILDIKDSTVDVDFCIRKGDYQSFKDFAENSQFDVDIFIDGYIFSEQLPDDYIDRASHVSSGLRKINLKCLSLTDIIITKAARYNERDEEDISTIAKTNKIDREELEERFGEVLETYAGREEDYRNNMNFILERHFGD